MESSMPTMGIKNGKVYAQAFVELWILTLNEIWGLHHHEPVVIQW